MFSRKIFTIPCLAFSLHLAAAAPAQNLELSPTASFIAQQLLASLQQPTPTATPSDPSTENPLVSNNTATQSNPFANLKITLQPELEISALPLWATTPVKINKEDALVEIKLPALSQLSEIESFALTVNFNDVGDGGPLVEWIKPDGDRSLICSGLGINGTPIGPNSRTIAIPYDLVLDGGTVVVSHTGRFDQILSIIVRPGRTAMVSALGGNITPAIVDESFAVIEKDLSEGGIPQFKTGDLTHGRITSAELKAPIERLSGELEFAFGLTTHPEATIFRTEVQGLDLESHIEIELNGTSVGTLNMQSFELDAPELISTTAGDSKTPQLQLAGWRNAYIYLPTYLWKEGGENHLVLIPREGARPSASAIHLKNSSLEVLQAMMQSPK